VCGVLRRRGWTVRSRWSDRARRACQSGAGVEGPRRVGKWAGSAGRGWLALGDGVGIAVVESAESACGVDPGGVKSGCDAEGGPIESP
jgi:hypothetical protein